ncbi:beta-galactosidase [Alloscardovia criceti]|uniref:beta-galactosidase n=1 Tax=Alloscardovia criceti TaxID=356828 RepID=UPI00037F20AD|nr:beta-galactosidase [Alloscardovia criceti]
MTLHSTPTWPALLTHDGTGIAFGGDYNPDQWPEEVWDEDIRLMKKAHVTVVALGIFSWDRIQPSEHEWDFAWLDKIIGKLGEAGIAVDLASATASAPMWLYTSYPEVLPVDKFGHVINPGSRQSWRPTSAVFKKFALQLCRKMAERYGSNPTVTSWHIGNEYGWNNRQDYSDDALRAFRAWCARKYGSVENLNAAWGASFWSQEVRSFEEVLLPRHMGTDTMVNPSQQLDFERFGNDMLLDFYKAERDVIKEICPDKPCTTNFMISTDQCSMDYAQWSREVDFVSNDHYFHEGESHLDELVCSDALVASIADGQPWYMMEHSTSAVQWKPLNARKRNGELVRDSLAHVAMGADAINFFQWRQSAFGAESFHSAMLPHAGEDTKLFSQVCELGDALTTLSKAGVQGSVVQPAHTAILFSAQSEWATRCETLPTTKLNHWHDVRDWYRAFLHAGKRADVVPVAGDWQAYDTVVLPSVLMLSDEDVSRLEAFTRAGGTVIIGYATGLVDEQFHVGLGGYPGAGNGKLRDMLGVRGEEFNILGDEADGEPRDMKLSNGMVSRLWQNDIRVRSDVEVLARYRGNAADAWELENIPAMTRAQYGAGSAIFIGCDLSLGDLARFIDDNFAHEKRGSGHSEQRTVLHTVRTTDENEFHFYISRSVLAELTISDEEDIIYSHQCEKGIGEEAQERRYSLDCNGILITKKQIR